MLKCTINIAKFNHLVSKPLHEKAPAPARAQRVRSIYVHKFCASKQASIYVCRTYKRFRQGGDALHTYIGAGAGRAVNVNNRSLIGIVCIVSIVHTYVSVVL